MGVGAPKLARRVHLESVALTGKTSMASFVLCTDHMLGFMEPDKSSSFCNYYVEPHLPTSCDAFTFWRENEAEGQDFIPGAGARFRHSKDL
jgi:hypothetical protein